MSLYVWPGLGLYFGVYRKRCARKSGPLLHKLPPYVNVTRKATRTGVKMTDRSGKRAAIFGKSGSGKTHFAKKNIVPGLDRVLAFDPEEEFADMPGFITVTSLQKLAAHALDCWEGNFRIAYVPNPGREEQELSEISRLVERYQEPFKAGQTNDMVTMVVDELNLSFHSLSGPTLTGSPVSVRVVESAGSM